MAFMVIKSRQIVFFGVVLAFVVLGSLNLWNGSAAAGLFFGNNLKLGGINTFETTTNQVALTFELKDAENAKKVLAELNKDNAHATFFVLGTFATTNQDLIKKLHEGGHSIGIMGNTDTNLTKLSQEQIKLELSAGIGAIEQITEKKPLAFRPNQMQFNDRVINTASELGLTTVLHTVCCKDVKKKDVGSVIKKVKPKMKAGVIINLCVDDNNSADKVALVLLTFKNKNLKPVGVNEFLGG